MTASLAGVAAYLPQTAFSLEKAAEVLDLTPPEVRRYRRFFGLDSVRWDPGGRQADLLVSAARRLPELRGNEQRVRYVLHARTIEPTGPYSPNPLHEVVRELGLAHASAFAISQHACASGLLAVKLAGQLLADAEPDALALVLTGEKTYPHVARFMPAATIMGEGAAACLVRAHGERDRLIAYASRTYGAYNSVTVRDGEIAAGFEQMYVPALADLITSITADAGIDLHDLRLILPHNVNRISWTRLCRTLDLPVERVLLDNVPVTGHCFCADPFINYSHARERELLQPGDHYLMASVGLGAVFSAILFRH